MSEEPGGENADDAVASALGDLATAVTGLGDWHQIRDWALKGAAENKIPPQLSGLARDLAEGGLGYLAGGPNAAQLHLKYGRAAARLGDISSARRAIDEAQNARERRSGDDLLQLGGEFGFSRASQHYLAGSTLLEITGAERDAATELERATELYAAGPGEGEDHSFQLRMLAHIELALARLRGGELDGARPALGPVLALPPGKRIDPLPQRLETVQAEFARSHGSPRGSDLDQEIEEFSRDTIVGVLSALPG